MLKSWLVIFVAMLIVDGVFHKAVLAPLYVSGMGDLLRPYSEIKLVPIVIVQLILTAGMVFFGIHANAAKNRVRNGAITGAYLGLLVAASYHLLNYAVLTHWSLTAGLIDIVWRMILGGAGGALLVAYYDIKVALTP